MFTSFIHQAMERVSPHVFTFRAGQIVKGEVLRIYPDQSALLQIGSTKMNAAVETSSLMAGQSSWFQVQNIKHPITLKMIPPQPGESTKQATIAQLLSSFQVDPSKQNTQLAQFFIQEQLPMSKNTLHQSAMIIRDLGINASTLQAIKWTILKGLPLNKETVQALSVFLNDQPLMNKWRQLEAQLPANKHPQQPPIFDITVAHQSKNALQSFLKSLGFQTENELGLTVKSETGGLERGIERIHQDQNFKLYLFSLLKDSSVSQQAKSSAQQLIQHLTGQQLMLTQTTDSFPFHAILQFPVRFAQHESTCYAHMEGRQSAEGTMNPDHCRMIFYLQLRAMGEICVDVVIQSKIVSVSIYNESHDAVIGKEWLKSIKPMLSQALHEHGYALSHLQWQDHRNDKSLTRSQYNPVKQGVDIRL